jgi:RNA polymerase sigma-70 factor (ECF subfamily)
MHATMTLPARAPARSTPETTLSDARALDRFLAGIERRAYRMALVGLGNRDDALDAVQGAMFKLARRYAHRPEAEWTPLFWSILRSRVTDLQRRRAVRNRFFAWFGTHENEDGEVYDPLAHAADPGGDPAQQLAERGALIAVERAVAALPGRQREAFSLRVLEGLDVAATAAAMGCSEGSVKTHLSRAMTALRAVLEEHI